MRDQRVPQATSTDVINALGELIEALDRGVPHVESAGEVGIARDAGTLRRAAIERIEELESLESNRQKRETDVAGAVMTDDGRHRAHGQRLGANARKPPTSARVASSRGR
jgi:hypothetical protein